MHAKLAEDGNSPQVLFHDVDSPPPPPLHHPPPLEMVTRTNTNKAKAPKYEAFMMTGERVIKMSKNTEVIFLFTFCFHRRYILHSVLFSFTGVFVAQERPKSRLFGKKWRPQ